MRTSPIEIVPRPSEKQEETLRRAWDIRQYLALISAAFKSAKQNSATHK